MTVRVTARRTTAPTSTPISVADLAKHLRIDDVASTAEQDELGTYIAAAVGAIENTCRISLIAQTWTGYIDAFPCSGDYIELSRPPAISLTTVKYYDESGVQQTLDKNSVCQVDIFSRPGRVLLAPGQNWPSTQKRVHAIELVWQAGFADASAVPAEIKHAMKLTCGDWYEKRTNMVVGNIVNKIPWAAENLLAPYTFPDAR